MIKLHVKKGDEVVVLAGTEKSKRGKILAVDPTKQRVIVEGLKIISKHTRKSQQYPQGVIAKREGTIHISNVMKAENYDARAAKRASGPAKA